MKNSLIARIQSDDPEQQMPPPKSNRRLTAEQKRKLERWVSEGAAYQMGRVSSTMASFFSLPRSRPT